MQTKKLAFALLPAYALASDTCKALVLSGGGANGAWEAGVLWGLYNYGNPDDFDYQVISGVSAGAINTAASAGWDPKDGVAMADYISYTWQTLTNSDIWIEWPGGLIEGATIKSGLLNNGPAFWYLKEQLAGFPEGYKRRVSLGSVNVETGQYTVFDQKNTAFIDLAHAAVSSASIPGAFPPHVWEGRGIFMDGGTVINVNVESAVQQCLELVDDPSKVIVDILVCGSPPTPDSKWNIGNTIDDFMLARDIGKYYTNADDLVWQKISNPKVNFRYLFSQSANQLSGLQELTFLNSTTWPLQENGRQVALATLNAGEGTMFNHFDEFMKSPELKQKHKSWGSYFSSLFNF